ncbi:N-acyl homoserine lactonase family protein [Streptomonospora salina]|uniref:Glyoxylase-like metal-dependent hydrolase (Beta-lactamase superfamily II) n=1 Tax=Streptomonospora salina TaxID=104205 RepID=A0A841E552_9ACTN|nr:N-acyl homoserine lactonase family protein [Streptomonospora salina]MBB5998136.1 glyoxylase-like metal-dependent hydrolase (beta-lactamase superfamily II) [Streptomonospora salina]
MTVESDGAGGGDVRVYAIRFAHREASVRGEHFYGHDPCSESPFPIDYYVWLVVSGDRTVLVDAGFTAETARARGERHYLRSPMETIAALGSDADRVSHVVLSHLHYDHVGHVADFPAASVVLQEAELAFWTSRHAGRGEHARLADPAAIASLVRENFTGRVRLVNGDHEVVPGVTVHRVGGHTPGLQVTRVETAQGVVVLAADGTHFFENIEQDRPYGVVNHLPSMYEAFDTIRSLAGPDGVVVPGHDPRVRERFPAVPGLAGLAVRIA